MSAGRQAVRRVAAMGLRSLSPPRLTDAVLGRDRLTVFAYHRIADRDADGFEFDPGVVSATPEMFERQMRHIAARFDVIALDDLLDHMANGQALPERPALITFDDGYRDNHDEALPVLRSLGLPAVVFLITGAIGTSRVMWWDELAYLLRNSEVSRAELPLVGWRSLEGDRQRAAVRLELLARLKEVPDQRRAAALEALRNVLAVAQPRLSKPLFMGWGEVQRMIAAGVDCQPHTVDHPLLTRIDSTRVEREISRSAAEVTARTGRPSRAFAYPNGDHNDAASNALRAAGVEIAFTMELGPCRPQVLQETPLLVPRIPLEARDSWDMFCLKTSGALAMAFRVRQRHSRRLAGPMKSRTRPAS